MKGFDGYAPINPAAAKAAGASAVSGYLVGNVPMTRAWVQACTDEGLLVWSAWELSADAAENGTVRGVMDASAAVKAALFLGQPLGTAIYFTNDSTVQDSAEVYDYFKVVAAITIAGGYVPGLYGQTSVWNQIKGFGYRYFWHAPDGTPPPYPEAHLVQSGQEKLSTGETVDVDEIQAIDFGGWSYALPTPIPLSTEHDMIWVRCTNPPTGTPPYWIVLPNFTRVAPKNAAGQPQSLAALCSKSVTLTWDALEAIPVA